VIGTGAGKQERASPPKESRGSGDARSLAVEEGWAGPKCRVKRKTKRPRLKTSPGTLGRTALPRKLFESKSTDSRCCREWPNRASDVRKTLLVTNGTCSVQSAGVLCCLLLQCLQPRPAGTPRFFGRAAAVLCGGQLTQSNDRVTARFHSLYISSRSPSSRLGFQVCSTAQFARRSLRSLK